MVLIRIETTPHSDDVAMALAAIDDFSVVKITKNGFLVYNELCDDLISEILETLNDFKAGSTRIAHY